MVDFRYLDRGVRVRGEWFPVLKMRWVEGGIPLNQFVERHLDRPQTLKDLLGLWPKMAARLCREKIAHADLQHGNVLLVPRDDGSLALKLIDYDGMYVPAFAGTRSAELGHPAFQHPQRSREGIYSAEVDRFSNLAIYSAIHCLTVGREKIWDRFNNDDNLLFREDDFRSPANSDVFQTLWELPDAGCRSLTGRLILACTKPLDQSPLLNEVTNGQVFPLTSEEEHAVESILNSKTQILLAAVVEPVESAPPPPLPEGFTAGPLLSAESMPSHEQLNSESSEKSANQLPPELVWDRTFHNILGGVTLLAAIGLMGSFLVQELLLFFAALLLCFSGWWGISLTSSSLGKAIRGRKKTYRKVRTELRLQEQYASSPEFVGEFWLGQVSKLVI